MKRHGLPGIGITAQKGKKGKAGPGFYFGPLDSFFVYIGDDILPDSSIDYEDIDYDITYVQNETRLDPKYKVGDILYVTDVINIEGKTSLPIMYMVEITEDLTTCTQEHFVKHIKQLRPFTIKSSLDKHRYLYPITIADVQNFNDEYNEGAALWEENLHNINNFVYNSLISINSYDGTELDPSILLVSDVSVVMDPCTYNYIPYTYFPEDYKRQVVLNDGKDIYKYTFPNKDLSTNLMSLMARANTYAGGGDDNQLLFYAQHDDGLFISTQQANKLFFDNLYIRKDNIGNADAYYTLYNDNFALDNNGNCYTLTQEDFNSSIQGFVISPDKFLNRKGLNISDYNYGYVHTYWNYNEDSIDTSTQRNYYYKPNYIRGNYLSTEPKTYYVYKTDEYGNYVRNWDDAKFKTVDIDELRQLLISTPANKTLFDVSDLIPSSVDEAERMKFYDVSGIIQIENLNDYVRYNSIKCIDVSVEYRDYGNMHLYTVELDGDTERLNEYHDELIITNPSLVVEQTTEIVIDPETGQPVIDPDTGEPQYDVVDEEQYYLYNTSVYISPSTTLIEKYIDVSYFSGIDMYMNPSNNMITLDKLDPNGLYYRHHEIMQWIADPEGLKYYSKKTVATYDVQTNSYIVEADWQNTNALTEYQKTSDDYPEPMFDIKVKNNKIYIDASNNGNQPYITTLGETILENSIERQMVVDDSSDTTRTYVYNSGITMNTSTFDDIIGTAYDLNLLNRIFENSEENLNVDDEYGIYEIPYYITDASNRSFEKKYITQIHFNDYKDYRTLPVIKMDGYNDIKRLEAANNIENGILCNQFSYFIDFNIEDFGYDNWGQMSQYTESAILDTSLNIDIKLQALDDSLLSDSIKTIIYAPIDTDIDVYHTSLKDLYIDNNNTTAQRFSIPGASLRVNTYEHTLTIYFKANLAKAQQGTRRIWLLFETKNPEPVYIYAHAYVGGLAVTVPRGDAHDENLIYRLNQEYLYNKEENYYLYHSKPLKAVIAPISYIAGYNQTMDEAIVINDKLQGSDEPINIAIKPYKLDVVEQFYTNFNDRSDESFVTNWSSLKFKKRFLQDNIKSISISTINVNYIQDKLRESDYCVLRNRVMKPIYSADDPDDIYETYLELVYNSDLYKSKLIEDQEQFVYNGELYLSSKYDQLNNNAAIYVKQENDYELRSFNLLRSMQKWNNVYPDYKYPSDNPYPGHIELYGNGYQYLSKTADTGQYLQENYMSLADIKELNKDYFFDTEDNEAYITDINLPEKDNPYTPTKLFRNLLYQMQWVYPRYYSQDGLNLIQRFPLKDATNGTINEMPYNLAYSIYPRMMFNDEEQVNVILMLRRPSIMEENKYKLTADDVYVPGVTSLSNLVNPINVLD